MSRYAVTCGFVPLTDAAPLVVAKEMGFAAEENIDLTLQAFPSWSSIRDMLAFGHLDAAHLLAPMPIAMSLGLGGLPERIDTLQVLSMNGNVIGVSGELADAMRAEGWIGGCASPSDVAAALRAARDGRLVIGVPFPFSMHAELLHYWMEAEGATEGRDYEIRSVPPSQMGAALAAKRIDAFCVGEPWGSQAVDAGVGEIILTGTAIWRMAPEKVLAARHDWAEEDQGRACALIRAVARAGRWLDQPDNRMIAAELLNRAEYLNLPVRLLDRALTGRLVCDGSGEEAEIAGFMRFFDGAATFPWRSQAKWIARRIAARSGVALAEAETVAHGCFRTDLYRMAMAGTGIDLPGASEKLEGALTAPTAVASLRGEMILGPDRFYDGKVFDPSAG
ncbi:CmpA/NrtA family ABC transporter substrate-binding protein [Pseudooceanicola nanhaiensis]|uniref:CmpA/NrtA family ABC transporter substrate-binding protein n=1 Tax=Pseudooceanicola nanhaiensis TaxID=375761 RepID=UPI001CD6794F|nr:CmpA/NrtA family ABC transporter substrate-binding protein [Pseudooceanicola nanhaiensis]MCA0919027.1 ABC transporter substrate-binding protein [Pseudooceanicola nanhaiensis]